MKARPVKLTQKKHKPNLHGPFSPSPTAEAEGDTDAKNRRPDDSAQELNKDKEEQRLDEEEKEEIQEKREKEIDKSFEDDDDNEKRERPQF